MIVQVGTNDVTSIGSQVLLDRIRRIIKTAKELRHGIQVSVFEIPSRLDRGDTVFSRSNSVNTQLPELCRVSGAKFISLGHVDLNRDGVHYSPIGSRVVARELVKEVESFLG